MDGSPKQKKNTYFANLWYGIKSSVLGLGISLRHALAAIRRRKPIYIDHPDYFKQKTGLVTLQYPFESIPVPDHGRYRLHNEMEDCIVCDKCAKICPVDCIEIEPIRATEQVGTTSDGSPIRLYAAKFDIDMAKCCYCGLCTTVCPTECLTMTKAYDFSEFDIRNMVYHFSNLNPEEAAEKIRLLEQFQKEKEEAKKKTAEKESAEKIVSNNEEIKKPIFKPKMPLKPKTEADIEKIGEEKPKPKVQFKPKLPLKKAEEPKPETENKADSEKELKPKVATDKPIYKPKLAFKPVIKPKDKPDSDPKKNN